jgi:hypothetical protein
MAMVCSSDVGQGFRIKLSSRTWVKCQLIPYLSLVSIVFANGIQAATIRVPLNAPTIQQAIDIAANGDVVLVAPGTYYENISVQKKLITVKSEQGPELTTIDGQNRTQSVVTLESGLLSGFTITNGNASFGGGIWIEGATPRVENNFITNNRACGGAGIIIVGNGAPNFPGPAIVDNEIRGNSTTGCGLESGGGGIFVSDVTGVLISGNKIIANSASPTDLGGGILIRGQSALVITDNVIAENLALYGGGIFMRPSTFSASRIEQNLIIRNQASAGGGIIAGLGGGERFNNNTIADNDAAQGSGLYFAENSFSTSFFTNNVIVAPQSQNAVDCVISSKSLVSFAFNNVFSPYGVAYAPSCGLKDFPDNISLDPKFFDPAAGNFQLRFGSPSIDTGTNLVHGLPLTDLNGDARIFDGDGNGVAVIDMGAYEYNGRPIAHAGPDQIVFCGADCLADVMLDGRESFDPEGSELTFEWTGPLGTVSGATPLVSLPRGEHVITLTVTDPSGFASSDSVVITAVDSTSPNVAAVSASPNVLLQANHQMVPVSISASVSDNCDATTVCQIISVTSNEPVEGLGDGDTSPDWEITGNLTVNIRAERSAHGTGRLYTITVQCSDSSGNVSTKAATVNVPRNN